MKTLAAEFDSKFMATVGEVQAKNEPVLVTVNGRPVARIVPVDVHADPLARFLFPGKVEIVGDIVAPLTDPGDWNALN